MAGEGRVEVSEPRGERGPVVVASGGAAGGGEGGGERRVGEDAVAVVRPADWLIV